jgi:hypothetical protein
MLPMDYHNWKDKMLVGPVAIHLSGSEAKFVEFIGQERRKAGIEKNRTHRFGLEEDESLAKLSEEEKQEKLLRFDVGGAAGECALAKLTNTYWEALTDYGAEKADVGGLYQVRATELSKGRLIVHPPDKNDQPFVLAITDLSDLEQGIDVTFPGWLLGHEAKQDVYWTDPGTGRPAYMVNQIYLRSMEDLPVVSR